MIIKARLSDIIELACQLSGETHEDVTGPCRTAHLCRVRSAIAVIAHPRYSYPQIGKALGGRDHSSIVYAKRKAETYARYHPDFAPFVARLRKAAANAEPFIGERERVRRAVERHQREVAEARRQAEMAQRAAMQRMMRNDGRSKSDFRPTEGEEADSSHQFHHGIKNGSARLAEAIAAARMI